MKKEEGRAGWGKRREERRGVGRGGEDLELQEGIGYGVGKLRSVLVHKEHLVGPDGDEMVWSLNCLGAGSKNTG